MTLLSRLLSRPPNEKAVDADVGSRWRARGYVGGRALDPTVHLGRGCAERQFGGRGTLWPPTGLAEGMLAVARWRPPRPMRPNDLFASAVEDAAKHQTSAVPSP